MSNVQRETTLRYIGCYQGTSSGEERRAIVEDFKGRFCDTDSFPVHRCNTMVCPVCQIPMNIRGEDGFLLCVVCGTTQVHTERSQAVSCSGEDADVQVLANKRETNFRDFLHLLQGKKLNPVLESHMPEILVNLAGCRGQVPCVQEEIISGLKAMGLRKFIKYVVLIEARLLGLQLTRIPIQAENRLCAMFLTIVDPYERNKPASRKHFISYAYCAWQFCRIENMPQFFGLFRLLKDERKIEQQDDIFRKICAEVGWQFESALRGNSIFSVQNK